MKWVVVTIFILMLIPIVNAQEIDSCQTFTGDNGYYLLNKSLNLPDASSCFHFGWGQNNVLDLGGHTITYDDWPASDVLNPSFEDGSGSDADFWTFSNPGSAIRIANQRFWHVGGNYTLSFPSGSPAQYVESDPIPVTAGRTYRAGFLYYGDNQRIYMTINGVCNNRVNTKPGPPSASYYYFCDYTPSVDETVVIRIGTSSNPTSTINVDLVNIAPTGGGGPITMVYNSGGLEITNGTIIQGSGKSWGGNTIGGRIGAPSGGGTSRIHNLNITTTGVGTEGIYVRAANDSHIYNNIVKSTRTYVWDREGITALITFTGDGVRVYNNTILNTYQTGIKGVGNAANYFVYNNYILMNTKITNGYGIEAYLTSGVNIYDNVIRGTGRGIHIQNGNGANVYGNDIDLYELINPEYPDINAEGGTGNCAHGIKNEGQSNSHIYNNNVTMHGYTDTYVPCPMNLGVPANGNTLVENNRFNAVQHDPMPTYRPAPQAMFITNTNGGVTIRNNTFISNRRGVTLFYNIYNLIFEDNTFINSDPGNGLYYALNIMEGSYTHFLNGLFYNNVMLGGADLRDVELATSASIDGDFEIRYSVTVNVQDNVGTPLFPATVTITRDRDNQVVFSETTNTGTSTVDLPETFIQVLAGGTYSDSPDAPYTVSVNYGGDIKTYPITLNQAEIVNAVYDFSGITVSNILCDVGSGMQDCSNIQYNSQLSGVQATCIDDGVITGARVVVHHDVSGLDIVDQLVSYNVGDNFVFDILPAVTVSGSGTVSVTVYCDDNSGFTSSNFVTSNLPYGTLSSSTNLPATNPKKVTDGDVFTYQTTLTCSVGDCGDVTSTIDPFDDSAWRVAYQETFDNPTILQHNIPFGTDGWLTPQLENGGTITIPGDGFAYINTADFWNAALIHSTNVLPEDWKIRVRIGNINYEWENYDATDRANPAFYNQNENGIYLITVTDALCSGMECQESWWHYHRKSVIDIDDHLENVASEHPIYMVWLDPVLAPWTGGGNSLHTWSSGAWQPLHSWITAYNYQSATYYIAEMEKNGNNLILRLYDSNENILEETTTVAWDGVAYNNVPEYFYTGEPHTDDYEGSAVYDDITLLVPLQQAKGGALPVGSGSPFFTNINPQTCTDMKLGDTCVQTWQVTTNTPSGSFDFFVIFDATLANILDINSSTVQVDVTENNCTLRYDVSIPCNNCIEQGELFQAITGWYNEVVGISELMVHIKSWKSCN